MEDLTKDYYTLCFYKPNTKTIDKTTVKMSNAFSIASSFNFWNSLDLYTKCKYEIYYGEQLLERGRFQVGKNEIEKESILSWKELVYSKGNK